MAAAGATQRATLTVDGTAASGVVRCKSKNAPAGTSAALLEGVAIATRLVRTAGFGAAGGRLGASSVHVLDGLQDL